MFLPKGDMKRVIAGVRWIDNDLRMLRLDYSPEARVFHLIYLGKILRHTRDLELRLHIAILNSTMAGRREGKKSRTSVLDDVHRVFASIKPALHHLHRLEFRARNGNPSVELFNGLDEDWGSFKRTVLKTVVVGKRPSKTAKRWSGNEVGRRREWATA